MAHSGEFELTIHWFSGHQDVLNVTSLENIFDVKKTIVKINKNRNPLELGQIKLTKLDDNSEKYIVLESFDIDDTTTLLKYKTLASYKITKATTIYIFTSECSTRLHTSVFLQKLIDGIENNEITTYKTGTSFNKGQLIKEEDSQALCNLNGWGEIGKIGKIGSSISFATSSNTDNSTKEYTYTKKQIKISLSTMYPNTDPAMNRHQLRQFPERLCTIKSIAPAKSLIIIGDKRFTLKQGISFLQRFPYDELEIKGELFGIRGEIKTERVDTPGVKFDCNVALCVALKRIEINHKPVSVHYSNDSYIDQLIQQYTTEELLNGLRNSDGLIHYFNFFDIAPYISNDMTNANYSSPHITEAVVADRGYIQQHAPFLGPGFAFPIITAPEILEGQNLERQLLVGNYRVLKREQNMGNIRAINDIAGHPHERSTPKKLHQYTSNYGRTPYGKKPTPMGIHRSEENYGFTSVVLGNPKKLNNKIGPTRKLHDVPFTQSLPNINENSNNLPNNRPFQNMPNPNSYEPHVMPLPNRGNQSKKGSIKTIKNKHNLTQSQKSKMPVHSAQNYNGSYGPPPPLSLFGNPYVSSDTSSSAAAANGPPIMPAFGFSAAAANGPPIMPAFGFSAAAANGPPIMPAFGSSAEAASGPPPLSLSRSGGKRKGRTYKKHHRRSTYKKEKNRCKNRSNRHRHSHKKY